MKLPQSHNELLKPSRARPRGASYTVTVPLSKPGRGHPFNTVDSNRARTWVHSFYRLSLKCWAYRHLKTSHIHRFKSPSARPGCQAVSSTPGNRPERPRGAGAAAVCCALLSLLGPCRSVVETDLSVSGPCSGREPLRAAVQSARRPSSPCRRQTPHSADRPASPPTQLSESFWVVSDLGQLR